MSDPTIYPVVLIDPGSVFCPDDNPNALSPEVFAALVNRISTQGFKQPILVTPSPELDDFQYTVVDGHHRLLAAIRLQMLEIPAVIAPMSTAERLSDRLGMNRVRGEVDLTQVARDLDDLMRTHGQTATELELTGFTAEEIYELTKPKADFDIDVLLAQDADSSPEATEVADKTHNITLKFTDPVEMARYKQMFAEAGDGDLALGLARLLG